MLASILEPVGVGQHAEIHGTKSTGAIREPERRRIEIHRVPTWELKVCRGETTRQRGNQRGTT